VNTEELGRATDAALERARAEYGASTEWVKDIRARDARYERVMTIDLERALLGRTVAIAGVLSDVATVGDDRLIRIAPSELGGFGWSQESELRFEIRCAASIVDPFLDRNRQRLQLFPFEPELVVVVRVSRLDSGVYAQSRPVDSQAPADADEYPIYEKVLGDVRTGHGECVALIPIAKPGPG
jgi:hypothetical protein